MSGATKLMTAGGGGVSLTPVSSIASDVTVNVPSQNCTLGIQGPAFSAESTSSQTVTTNVITKVQLSNELFDTNGCFDPSVNYRFTPNVAGYYQINFTVNCSNSAGAAPTRGFARLYKNGSQTVMTEFTVYGGGTFNGDTGKSVVISMNGTTDYIELYAQNVCAGTPVVNGYLSGSLVRAA